MVLSWGWWRWSSPSNLARSQRWCGFYSSTWLPWFMIFKLKTPTITYLHINLIYLLLLLPKCRLLHEKTLIPFDAYITHPNYRSKTMMYCMRQRLWFSNATGNEVVFPQSKTPAALKDSTLSLRVSSNGLNFQPSACNFLELNGGSWLTWTNLPLVGEQNMYMQYVRLHWPCHFKFTHHAPREIKTSMEPHEQQHKISTKDHCYYYDILIAVWGFAECACRTRNHNNLGWAGCAYMRSTYDILLNQPWRSILTVSNWRSILTVSKNHSFTCVRALLHERSHDNGPVRLS